VHGAKISSPEQVTLYDTTRYVIKPATRERGCSYVEWVASGPQIPAWFCSHWWGESILNFLRCLEQHAWDHDLPIDTPYWVCAYANNQHHLEQEISHADPSDSSFMRAISLTEGRVLSILDAEGTCHRRIWCCLETHQALLGQKGLFEVYTAREGCRAYDMSRFQEISAEVGAEGLRGSAWIAEVYRRLPILTNLQAVGLTDGPTKRDHARPACQTLRQSYFPLDLIKRSFDIQIQSADATKPRDLRHILNWVVGRRGAELDALEPLAVHTKYDDANARLHGSFVAHAFRLLLEKGDAMQPNGERLRHSGLKRYGMSFRDSKAFTDATAQLLATTLPPTLEEIRLEITASGATSVGGNALLLRGAMRLQLPTLRVLEMNDCLLTCAIPDAIGECVALEELILSGNKMAGPLPRTVGGCVSLRMLHAQNNEFNGELPAELSGCVKLSSLRLNGNQLAGPIPPELGRCAALTSLRLTNNQLVGPLPEELADCVTLAELNVDDTLLEQLPARLKARKDAGELAVNRTFGPAK